MIKNFVKIIDPFRKRKILLFIILIFLTCIFSYGQIMDMYFFLEDYLILYSIQNPNSPDAGYGSGIFGRPYGYAVTPFIPFYYLFGLNPFGYYLIEIILYFLTALSVYFITKTLTGNTKVALGASLIFASGYVGSESLYRLAVGWQNILAGLFISLTAAFYYKYIKCPKLKYYFIALAVYIFTSEFSFYRAHGIIIVILSLEILFNFKAIRSIFQMVPFIFSYWYFYVYSLPFIEQGSKLASFIEIVFTQKNYHFLITPFKTLENLFLPDKFHVPLLVFVVLMLLILALTKSKKLLFCLIFAISNFLVHFYVSPGTPQETTHRYLTVSFIGVAMFWAICLNEVFKKTYFYLFFCMIIVIINLSLVRQDQLDILQNRSQPSSSFWQAFKDEVQNLSKNSVIYIDSKKDGLSRPARDAAVGAGSMGPTTSFAAHYGLSWRDIYLAENFNEVLNLIKEKKISKDNVFTFFYVKNSGLVNTTNQTRDALFGKKNILKIENYSKIEIPISTPVQLKFTSDTSIEAPKIGYSDKKINLVRYLQFLTSRENFWETAKVKANTQVKYAEISNIYDNNLQTSWRADDLTWRDYHNAQVIVDLGKPKQIGGTRLTPATISRAPMNYSYECSIDGNNWSDLYRVERKTDKIEPFSDRFKDNSCVYLRLTILKTISGGPPQISEIEVIESPYIDLDVKLAEDIEASPFKYLDSIEEVNILADYFVENGVFGKICTFTNLYNNQPECKKHKFKMGVDDMGSFFVSQGGSIMQKVDFIVPEGIFIKTSNVELEYLNYKDLETLGYIK